ncbi:MAG: hypothetical protein QW728_02110, partial [Thermoplasmata archaeon]
MLIESPFVAPLVGNETTPFIFWCVWSNYTGKLPLSAEIVIDGTQTYSLSHTSDTSDGKKVYSISNLSFSYKDGTYTTLFRFKDLDSAEYTMVGPEFRVIYGAVLNHEQDIRNISVCPENKKGWAGDYFNFSLYYRDADVLVPPGAYICIDGIRKPLLWSKGYGEFENFYLLWWNGTLSAGSHAAYFVFNDTFGEVRAPEADIFVTGCPIPVLSYH